MDRTPIAKRRLSLKPREPSAGAALEATIAVFPPIRSQESEQYGHPFSCRAEVRGGIDFVVDAPGVDSYDALENALAGVGAYLVGQSARFEFQLVGEINLPIPPQKETLFSLFGVYLNR